MTYGPKKFYNIGPVGAATLCRKWEKALEDGVGSCGYNGQIAAALPDEHPNEQKNRDEKPVCCHGGNLASNSPMEQSAFKNVNNCLKSNIYSYLETSGGKSSNLYSNVVHFFNTSVN